MKKKLVPTKNRSMTSISMRIPADLLEKLKKVAPLKEMSGHQSLIKYYFGQGLLRDAELVRMVEEEDDQHGRLEQTLKEIGLSPEKIEEFWNQWRRAYPSKTVREQPGKTDKGSKESGPEAQATAP